MFERVKMALRITTTAFDDEIRQFIDDCLAELRMLGIYRDGMSGDNQIISTVIFYCKARFGNNPDADRWEKIYSDKVSKLLIAKGYGADGRQEAE